MQLGEHSISSRSLVAPVRCTTCWMRRWRPELASGCTLARPECGTGRQCVPQMWWTSELRSGILRASKFLVVQWGPGNSCMRRSWREWKRNADSGKPSHTFRTCNVRGRFCFNARDRVATTCCARCHQPSHKSTHRNIARRIPWRRSSQRSRTPIGDAPHEVGRIGVEVGAARCTWGVMRST